MYYDKKELERIREKGLEDYQKIYKQPAAGKYDSEADLPITCTHCKNELFLEGNAMLNTRGATFLGLEWLNGSAITLTCSRCGYIHWFAKGVRKIS